MNRDFLSIVAHVSRVNEILVVGHVMPDGDDVSSVLSAKLGLSKLGKAVRAGIDWDIPWFFQELPETREIENFETLAEDGFSPEVVLVLDTSSPDRVGRFQSFLEGRTVCVIDHHATNTLFGTYNWVDTKFGSTAQMVLRLNKELGVEYDERLATVNFLGIATDTGFFRYSNADWLVFSDAAHLVNLGAKAYEVSRLFESKKVEQFKLFATMVEHMKLEYDGLIVYSYLRYEDYATHGCNGDDSSGFVGELRSIRGVELAVFFSEISNGEVHVSLRSKDWFDCSRLAVLLGGGGHPRAAGCTLKGDLDVIMEEVIREAKILMFERSKA